MNFLDSTHIGSVDGSLQVGPGGETQVQSLTDKPRKADHLFYNKNRICGVKMQINDYCCLQ